MHACVRAHTHTCIPHECTVAYMHACIAHMHTSVHAYILTYIQTKEYILTNSSAYLYIYMYTYLSGPRPHTSPPPSGIPPPGPRRLGPSSKVELSL